MSETKISTGTPGNAEPLLPVEEHPLVIRRIELHGLLHEILGDMDRYNSKEWYQVQAEMADVTGQIREQGVDTSRYHSSLSFPGPNRGALEVLKRRGQGQLAEPGLEPTAQAA